jgi:thioesterase domain-containing protein
MTAGKEKLTTAASVSSRFDKVEPVARLGLTVATDGLDAVAIDVPLDGNKNDKNTMFAGSQFSGMVLAGWRLASNWAVSQGITVPVVIKSTQMEFMRPVDTQLHCVAAVVDQPSQGKSGNWKLDIRVEARDEQGVVCAVLQGDYRVLVA